MPGTDDTPNETLVRATSIALHWHADHTRKGSRIPYSSHLFQVMGGVLEHGGDTEQAVAALFHDALEDAPSPEERSSRETRIREEFGVDVLAVVLDCTDTGAGESLESKAPWRDRKTRFLAALGGADERSTLVVACDKRHNLHTLVWDVRTQGAGYLDRFSAGAEEQIWYFESILEVLSPTIPPRLLAELRELVCEFKRLAG